MRKLLPIATLLIVILGFTLTPVFAQEVGEEAGEATNDASLGLANNLNIKGENIQSGHIISSTGDGFVLTGTPYDPQMVGIVTEKPAVSFNLTGSDESSYPVITSGSTYVLVNGENGDIKKGDLVTSSSTSGIGMKSQKSGYTLGSAMEDVKFSSKEEVKNIAVALNIKFSATGEQVKGQLSDIFKLSAMAATESPSAVFKYVVAALVVILGFVLGFLTFGRTAAKGVDALGRNPMAVKFIQLGIAMNVFITVAIILSSLGIGYLILRI